MGLAMGLFILRHSITQFVLKYSLKYTSVPTTSPIIKESKSVSFKEPKTTECTYTPENGFACMQQSPQAVRSKPFPTITIPPVQRSHSRSLLNMYSAAGSFNNSQ